MFVGTHCTTAAPLPPGITAAPLQAGLTAAPLPAGTPRQQPAGDGAHGCRTAAVVRSGAGQPETLAAKELSSAAAQRSPGEALGELGRLEAEVFDVGFWFWFWV